MTIVAANQPTQASPRTRALVEFLLDNLVWLILVVVLVVFSLTVPNYFQLGIFANIVEQSTFVGTLAIGLALVIIAGHHRPLGRVDAGTCRHGAGHAVRRERASASA